MAKLDDNFSWNAYLFIIDSIRDEDEKQNNVLERYMGGIQQHWENIFYDIDVRLPTLWSLDEIEDEYLKYMLWIVGFTSEMAHITGALTDDQRRKLIRLAVPFWKIKGTELGIRDALRLLTGRSVIIWNWFQLRWTLEASGLYRLHRKFDSVMVGNDYGERDEYFTLIWVNLEDGSDQQLVADLVNLNAPIREAYLVVFAELVDDFAGGKDRWVDQIGTTVWSDTDFNLTIPSSGRTRVNVSGFNALKDVVWRHTAAYSMASGGSHRIYLRRQDTGNFDYYRVTFTQAGVVTIEQFVATVLSTVATTTLSFTFPVDETTEYGVDIYRTDAGHLTIEAYVYGLSVLSYTFDEPNIVSPGEWEVENNGGASLLLDDVIAYGMQPGTALIDNNTTVVTAPAEITPGRRVYYSADVTGYTLTSLWHSSTYRYLSPPNSIYFGTGESGYFTQPGTAGTMGGGIAAGTATSGSIDLSNYSASKYNVYLSFWQYLDIRADPDDQMVVQILVSAVVVQTISKADLLAAGNGVVEFDISAAVAGNSAVQIRFNADTVSSPGSEEGWFVDDVKVVLEEI